MMGQALPLLLVGSLLFFGTPAFSAPPATAPTATKTNSGTPAAPAAVTPTAMGEKLPARLALDAPAGPVRAGFFKLSWRSTDGAPETPEVELECARRPDGLDGRIIYRGTDDASSRSGLRNGTYHYRIRRVLPDKTRSAWSPRASVVVEHHPLSRALAFLAAGAAVFASVVLLILRGGND